MNFSPQKMCDLENGSESEADETAEPFFSRSIDLEQEKKLLQPFLYTVRNPGKKIRSKLAKAFNYWMHVPEPKLAQIELIIEMLHNASLLLDDIEDNSVLRRGIPVAHSIYGTASTINAANYVYFIALEKCLTLGHPKVNEIYTEQLLELHRGQGMDIYWRDNFICPSEDEYKLMTMRKTGGLFFLAIRLMELFSECEKDFRKLIGILGLYFQIRDDYCNLCSAEYAENKSFGEDLTEGKFSFPIIHAIQKYPNDKQVINILKQRTSDIETKKYCIKVLRDFGSFEYTRKVLGELETEAREQIRLMGENPQMLAILDSLRVTKVAE